MEGSNPSPEEVELLAQGTTLIAELKQLEAKAANYNALAVQVFAEETACLKELKEKRKAVQAFLKSSRSHLKSSPSSPPQPLTPSPSPVTPPTTQLPALSIAKNGQRQRRGSLDLESITESLKRRLAHIEFQLPRPAKLILRLALGASAPTTLRPLSHRLQFKKEVEVFKLTMTVIGLSLSALCLSLSPASWPATTAAADAAFLFTLIYYYSTVTLREHILVVNGSRIRFWWFIHHYLSIVLTGIMIIWLSSPSFQLFRHTFLMFSAYLGAVQYLQFRYQRKRLYVLVAMDMVSPMDTVSGDGVHTDRIERELLVLVPFLCFAQLWQVYNSWVLTGMWAGWSGRDAGLGAGEWHVLAASILFGLLGFGNMVTTLRTFLAKRRSSKPAGTGTHTPSSGIHSPGGFLNGNPPSSTTPPPPYSRAASTNSTAHMFPSSNHRSQATSVGAGSMAKRTHSAPMLASLVPLTDSREHSVASPVASFHPSVVDAAAAATVGGGEDGVRRRVILADADAEKDN
ncbi:hypothetical protein HDU97_008844 [Phlyctochytrium planicorne]|nr:hypothetical protein HDU97_008844 [Phlyctochytrium planicorne]